MQHLPLTLADLQTLLARAREEMRGEDVLQRLEWIIAFVEHGQSLEDTANLVGISPATLRRWIKRFNPSDLSSLEERSHMPQRFRTSTVPAEVVGFIREYREREPLLGKERISDLLLSEHQVTLSASTVGRVIEREKLYFADTPLHLRKRITSPAAPQPILAAALPAVPVAVSPAEPQRCACLLCKIYNKDWKYFKRSIVLGSVLANIAIVALVAATMLLEREGARPEPAKASLLHTSAPIEQTDMPAIDSDSRQ